MPRIKYENMTRAQRRVAIAKDVIAAIHAQRFREISTGCYVSSNRRLPSVVGQENAERVMPNCKVCARGAMMLVKVAKYNGAQLDGRDLEYGGHVAQDITAAALEDAFTSSQLGLIEAAFEQTKFHADNPVSWEAFAAMQFGYDHINDEDRLIAIMQNIIDHDGEFKPEVRYDVVLR